MSTHSRAHRQQRCTASQQGTGAVGHKAQELAKPSVLAHTWLPGRSVSNTELKQLPAPTSRKPTAKDRLCHNSCGNPKLYVECHLKEGLGMQDKAGWLSQCIDEATPLQD